MPGVSPFYERDVKRKLLLTLAADCTSLAASPLNTPEAGELSQSLLLSTVLLTLRSQISIVALCLVSLTANHGSI